MKTFTKRMDMSPCNTVGAFRNHLAVDPDFAPSLAPSTISGDLQT
jgi:hypothetical protein